ncbi:MAG: SDR family oxidoreductase [Acholeplasmataceae bacterium]|nr:SDR family oxidoreductase [Acholeplasmataceae bacterium]
MKVIVITGASSGIGLSIAQHLSQKGHSVYGISRSKIHEKNVKSIQADVTDYNQLKEAYQGIFEIEGRIDVLINNAGMGISGTIEDTSSEDAAYIFNVNFMGVFNSTKAALPYLRESDYGKVLNISSVAARLSIPFQAFYSSSKAAVNSFSEALANEVAPLKIQVCSIMPGDIRTGFTKNRKKNEIESPEYNGRVDLSVAVMEKDERNGMDPESAAKVVNRLVRKRRIPLYKTVGFKYKVIVLLAKLLPAKLANHIVGSIYAFKKGK